jgi:uncharacterized membrane protein (DUF106 family)
MDKQGHLKRFFIVMTTLMVFSLVIVTLWDRVPIIKNAVGAVLNPSAGKLILWNNTLGSLIVFLIIAVITTLVQKLVTDQETLKEIKKEQKKLQKEIKKYRKDPEKSMQLQKDALPKTFEMMELQMKGSFFTIIPFILLIRWFHDFYAAIGNPTFLSFFSWFWFYLVSLMVFSSILRKVFKMA